MAILDQAGQPISRQVLASPQTSQVQILQRQFLSPMLQGLTPAVIAQRLRSADQGYLIDQHRLFSDMEDRDAHLACEINKRKLALLTLDWDIVPPRNASFQEKKTAAWLKEVLTDAVDPVEDLILALMDGVGHGFAACELEWTRWGAEWLPSFHPRPQEWFCMDPISPVELRLRDSTQSGAALLPFGWVLHTHGKAKTGYLGRMGLYRAAVWPFLYKFYGVADLAEFLECYGLPIILGKYFTGASDADKTSLMQAVVDLGHDARAIMPEAMQVEIQKITGSGDGSPHMLMIDWAERSQSKLILGQVLSAEAKATGMGSGTANLHGEVRHDILTADARQVGATLTRDLCYPLIALNRGVDSLQRCPRFVFDTGQPEDLKLFADSLPKLVGMQMQIPVSWAHEKLKIPLAEAGEETLSVAQPDVLLPPAERPAGASTPAPAAVAAASLVAALATPTPPPAADPTPVTALAEQMDIETRGAWQQVLDHVERLVMEAPSMEALQQTLLAAYDGLPREDLRKVMESGFSVARLAGLSDVTDEAAARLGPANGR